MGIKKQEEKERIIREIIKGRENEIDIENLKIKSFRK